jgi:hypothetical protein
VTMVLFKSVSALAVYVSIDWSRKGDGATDGVGGLGGRGFRRPTGGRMAAGGIMRIVEELGKAPGTMLPLLFEFIKPSVLEASSKLACRIGRMKYVSESFLFFVGFDKTTWVIGMGAA